MSGLDGEEEVEITAPLNGKPLRRRVKARQHLADFLRQELELTGTHLGCEHGVCGACTVLVNGEAVRACLMLAVQANGDKVVTVEGLSSDDLSPLQASFRKHHALQCGFCTPGMLIAAHALLAENLSPTDEEIREAIGGNLCRCTGYKQIVDAIALAAERLRGSNRPAHEDTTDEL